jgi:hypothetical protein
MPAGTHREDRRNSKAERWPLDGHLAVLEYPDLLDNS